MKLKRILSALLAALMLAGVCMTGIVVSADDSLPFIDVKNDWSYDSIKYVYENGLMNGVDDGTKFAPNNKLTRAMVVTVLYRNNGSPSIDYEDVFLDVEKGKYYSEAAVWAYTNGIVNGTHFNEWGDPYFSPDTNITRQELATMFKRYADSKYVITDNDRADLSGYPDNGDVAKSWALEAVQWAVAIKLINGKSNNGTTTLSPKDPASRAEFATIIRRFNDAFEAFEFKLVYNEPVPISTYTEKEYPLVNDADIYVSVDGNDETGDGSLNNPYATFEKAVKEVRKIKETAKNEIVVAFKAGNYGNLQIELTAEDAGTKEVPITYCKYGDGDVTFSNGVDIALEEFTPIDESDYGYFNQLNYANIYKADLSDKEFIGELSKYSQLYSEDMRFNAARFPNKNGKNDQYLRIGTRQNNKKVVLDSILADHFNTYHTYEGISSIGALGAEYLSHHMTVDSYDPETATLKYTKGAMQGIGEEARAYFQNISEELDAPYEFWVDIENKVLYVYEPANNYTLSTARTFITLTDADYINFVGIDFKHCISTALMINSDYVTVDNAEIMGVASDESPEEKSGVGGVYAIHMNGYGIKLTNSELSQLDGGGVIVYGGDWENLTSSDIVIDNNYIHDYGLSEQTYKPAVRLMNSVGTKISHNEICNAPHSAIIFGQAEEDRSGRAINNIMEYNYIHNVNKEFGDAGALYAGRTYADRGNVIRYNIIAKLGGGSWGIYLDDGLSGQEIYGNVFYNPGGYSILMSGGRDNTITGNVTVVKPSSTNVSPLRIWAKYAEMLDESLESLNDSPTWGAAFNSHKLVPDVGTEGRKIWEAKWPELFDAIADLSITQDRLDDYRMLAQSAGCIIKDNYSFGICEDNIISSEYSSKFNEIENNPIFTNENDPEIFVNPALGNYTVKDGADYEDNNFEMIGRY